LQGRLTAILTGLLALIRSCRQSLMPYKLVILTGNAGDGKTAFIQHIFGMPP
jgi:tRNA A37 threonylcarbamoyladenosine biosynthesis protein TsaE